MNMLVKEITLGLLLAIGVGSLAYASPLQCLYDNLSRNAAVLKQDGITVTTGYSTPGIYWWHMKSKQALWGFIHQLPIPTLPQYTSYFYNVAAKLTLNNCGCTTDLPATLSGNQTVLDGLCGTV